MYKTLLSDYDTRQRELMLENAELRKVLQQMKKDMVSILSSRKPTLKGDKLDNGCVQVSFSLKITQKGECTCYIVLWTCLADVLRTEMYFHYHFRLTQKRMKKCLIPVRKV